MNRQVERHLIQEVVTSIISQGLADSKIEACRAHQICKGRSDLPPYLSDALKMIIVNEVEEERAAESVPAQLPATMPRQVLPPQVIDSNTAGAQAIEQYVTLDMAAAMVNRKKRTLEEWIKRSDAPMPDVEGGGGKPHEWKWKTIKPWLEKKSNRQLPDIYPAIH